MIDVSERDTVPEDLVLFALPGRDYIVLDPGAPLPQLVIDEMTARVAGEYFEHEAQSMAGTLSRETGKNVLLVFHFYGTADPEPTGDTPNYDLWRCADGTQIICPHFHSEAEAVATAQAHVAAQPDPDSWVVIVG